ncbi:apurinic endonuclease Apn1 [Acidimicrobium ferrooxidans DSM 10331]|uniref:Apurinic endonuclease Apn1 n=1 Tax=Acidimicrobium ferrooxidans (strain DSM 10331 / JCM 15462 / NBRC 103882 / ICP) TaxID=525909 RepID=C7LZK8_ACIFD|nr:deoxyribonuclease IV [Acidimicrobium ferrooxidans]ACU54166.1 apurinic endonuclease Apn1 [Acidimicrobium ferrooxidans DSM 10331]
MRVGCHVSAAGGVLKMLERAGERGASVAQCFLGSPRSWRWSVGVAPEPDVVREAAQRAGVERIVVHASYLINLASVDAKLRDRSLALLRQTAIAAEGIGAESVVVHAGSAPGDDPDAARQRIREGLERVLEATSTIRILVENPATGSVASGPAELGALAGALRTKRVGVCLDTQHLFAVGWAIDEAAGREEIVTALQAAQVPVALWHCNDSASERGRGRDRHANIGEGAIGAEALCSLVADRRLPEADVVLEVPGAGDGPRAEDVAAVRALLVRHERL